MEDPYTQVAHDTPKLKRLIQKHYDDTADSYVLDYQQVALFYIFTHHAEFCSVF
jgi:hypothetical protein